MIKNQNLVKELELLAEAQEWRMIAKWFSYWKDLNEMIDKVLLFGHFFMPEHFRDSSPRFHRRLIKSYFSESNKYEAAPRGFSKTTLFQCCILFECVNGMQKFIAVIEKTAAEAAEVIGGVRSVCAESEDLYRCYGNLLGSGRKSITGMKMRDKDSEGDIFVNKVRIRGKGFETGVRGLKSNAWRPTKILCDDIEKDEHINSPEQRAKYRNNYDKNIQPAVDPEGSIKVFGTILHEDSLLNNLITQHNGKIYRAYYTPEDEEWDACRTYTDEVEIEGVGPVRLLWGSRWSWDRLMKKKSDMRNANQSSHAFEQEYRNYPLAEEDRKFKRKWLFNEARTITLSALKKAKVNLRGFASIDVAESKALTADYTATIVMFVDEYGNWYRVDVREERRNINDLINLIFEVWDKWSPMGLEKIGIEKKAFNDQIKPLLDEAVRIRMKYPVVEELKPMGRSKESRILGALQGRYEYAKIWTVTDDSGRPVGDTKKLLEQLYNFPASKNDDLSDAEAYISDIAEVAVSHRQELNHHHAPQDDPYAEKANMNVNTDPYEQAGTHTIHGNPSHIDDPY